MKRYIIASNKPNQLELYHYTTIEKFISILKTNTFKLGPWANLSMTTQTPDSVTGKTSLIWIKLNSNLLSKHYKIKPYDSTSGNDGIDNEQEYRITASEHIQSFTQYIESIYVSNTWKDNEVISYMLSKEFNGTDKSGYEQFIEFIDSHNLQLITY